MGTLWCNWQQVFIDTTGNGRGSGKNPTQLPALGKAMSHMVLTWAEGDQPLDTDPHTKASKVTGVKDLEYRPGFD